MYFVFCGWPLLPFESFTVGTNAVNGALKTVSKETDCKSLSMLLEISVCHNCSSLGCLLETILVYSFAEPREA